VEKIAIYPIKKPSQHRFAVIYHTTTKYVQDEVKEMINRE
jgi:hypothetical protein